ncbi:SDR family oxidoreductase [soil metagenome]
MSQTLLVLGARSDIAQATAHEFAAGGFDVILAARNAGSLEAVKSDLEIRHGVAAHLVEFDAADYASHAGFYAGLPAAPDVVLYAIGYLGEQSRAERNWSEAEQIISSNYTGAVSILSIAANDLEARDTGTIIGIGSVAGDRGRQSIYIYGSAKSGLAVYLAGLRHRLAKTKVTVLTVKPGPVYTQMTEGMDLPKMLTAVPNQVGTAIFKAYKAKKHTIYVFPVWRLVMYVIRNLPEFVFVKTKL